MFDYLLLVFFSRTVNCHCKILCWVLFLVIVCLGHHVLGRLVSTPLALIWVVIAAFRLKWILLALFAALKIPLLLLHLVCQLLLNNRDHPWLGFSFSDVKLSTIFNLLSGWRLRAVTLLVEGKDWVIWAFLWLNSLRAHPKNTWWWRFLLK